MSIQVEVCRGYRSEFQSSHVCCVHVAAATGQEETVREMLDSETGALGTFEISTQRPGNKKTKPKRRPVFLVIFTTVRVDAERPDGTTPLHYAAAMGEFAYNRNFDGRMNGACVGHENVVRLLLREGADVEVSYDTHQFSRLGLRVAVGYHTCQFSQHNTTCRRPSISPTRETLNPHLHWS